MNLNEIEKYVRDNDKERYLLSQFLPKEIRDDLMPIYAFNLELARIPEITKEEIIRMIRLTWWREAIEEIYNGKIRNHYIVTELAKIIEKHKLEKMDFFKIIDARQQDFEPTPFQTLQDLINYLEQTSGTLTKFEAIITNSQLNQTTINDLAVAYGLVGIIRSQNYNESLSRSLIPTDLTNNPIETLATTAKEKLTTAQKNKFFKLKHAATNFYLNRIKKASYDVTNNNIEEPRWPLIIKLLTSYYF